MSSTQEDGSANGTRNANGNAHDSERQARKNGPSRRGPIRAMVQDFNPIWFTYCMNAGIIALILHQYPYQFPGIGVLATIAWMIDFVFFIIFSILYIWHFAWFRTGAYYEFVDDIQSLGLFACWPIAWQTLVAFVSLTVSQAHWGGHAFTIVAYVMWWFGAAWIIGTLLFVLGILITRHNAPDRVLSPLVLIPTVGVATTAVIGGLVASYSANISARLAVPVIIAAFCTAGIGLIMAIFIYTYLFHQLLAVGWPSPEQTASLFVLVGPMGQSSSAFQALGDAASTFGKFGGYNKGTFLTTMAASPLSVACILIALILTGMSAIFFILAMIAMVYRAFQRKLSWNPSWNAIIFPTGTFTTSMLLLSIELNSPFFRVMTGIFLVFLVIVFFVNLGFTFWGIFKGELLIVRDDPRAEKED